MGKVSVEGYQCDRCGYIWVRRQGLEQDPVICAKCKSPYWNRGPKKKREVFLNNK